MFNNNGTWNDASTQVTFSVVEWTGTAFRAAAGVAGSVMENATAGTVIGTLATTDADASDTATYTLVGGATSKFQIVGNQLQVKSGATFDYETTPVETVTVRVTDAGGLTRDLTTTVNVVNVNEAPTNTGVIGSTNLISNGSFETGVTGWTTSGSTNAVTTQTGQGTTNGTSALVFSWNGAANDGVASQTIATTVGQTYTVTFDMGAIANTTALNQLQTLNFQVNGATTLVNENLTDDGSATTTFNSYRYTFVADSTSTTIRFADASSVTTNININLDNVQMYAVTTTSPTMSIAENSANGTVVGQVASTDPDAYGVLTYSLTNNAGGAFAINSTTGQVTVANTTLLDFETTPTSTIVVRTTDQGGLTFDKTMTINLTNVNEAPTAVSVTAAQFTMQFDSSSTLHQNSVGTSVSTATAGGTVTAGYDSIRGGVANVSNSSILIDAEDQPALGSNYTLFARFRDLKIESSNFNTLFRGAVDHQIVIHNSTNELGYWDNDGGVGFKGTGYFVTALDDNQWHSIAVAVNNGVYTYYVDGTAVGNTVSDSTITTLAQIGGHFNTQDFATAIDDFRYFSSTLSAGQIGTLNSDTESTLTVVENATNGTLVGSANARDVDASTTLTYSLTDSAGGRFAINSTNGAITVANGSLLNFEAAISHNITVRATDQGGLTFDRVVTINLTNVNEAPTAVADTAIAVEAGGVANGTAGTNPTGNVLTNDTDVDAGDTKTVSGVAAGTVGSASTNVGSAVTGTYGSVNIAANGAYTYTVDNTNAAVQALRTTGNTLSDVFTYTMRDTAGLTSTTQITVTIQGANDTPLALDAQVANQAMVLDGVNDYILMDDGAILSGATELTMDVRFRYDSSTPNGFLAGRYNAAGSQSHGFALSGGKVLAYFNDYADRYIGSTTLVNGQTYDISATMDAAGVVQIYINGVAETVTEQANGYTGTLKSTAGGKTLIGGDADGFGTYNQFTKGQFMAFRYWNSAQSQGTISARIGQTIVGNESGLLGAWDARSVAGDRLIDLTGRGLHGVLNNGVATLLPVSIAENSANGTVVATAVTADVDSGDSFTYNLVSNAGGTFCDQLNHRCDYGLERLVARLRVREFSCSNGAYHRPGRGDFGFDHHHQPDQR